MAMPSSGHSTLRAGKRGDWSRPKAAAKALEPKAEAGNVWIWHDSDLPKRLLFGRFRGQSRHQAAIAEQLRFMSTRPRPRQ